MKLSWGLPKETWCSAMWFIRSGHVINSFPHKKHDCLRAPPCSRRTDSGQSGLHSIIRSRAGYIVDIYSLFTGPRNIWCHDPDHLNAPNQPALIVSSFNMKKKTSQSETEEMRMHLFEKHIFFIYIQPPYPQNGDKYMFFNPSLNNWLTEVKHRDTSASNHVKCTKAKIISGRILTKNLQGTRVRAPHELGCFFRAKSGLYYSPK